MTTREIIEAALALPPEERAKVIDELSVSLGEDDEFTANDELVARINERSAAFERGEPGIPAEEAMARLRQR